MNVYNEIKKYYWFDYAELVNQYIGHNEKIVNIYYFTAYYTKDIEGTLRHKEYVNALAVKGIKTITGKFQRTGKSFVKQKNKITQLIWENIIKFFPATLRKYFLPEVVSYKTHEEKRTDVNIATQIIVDGFNDVYDKAIIITGDSDITPAIEAVRKKCSSKYFLCVLPKEGKGWTISSTCDNSEFLTEEMFAKYQLPDTVISKSGKTTYSKPKEWN